MPEVSLKPDWRGGTAGDVLQVPPRALAVSSPITSRRHHCEVYEARSCGSMPAIKVITPATEAGNDTQGDKNFTKFGMQVPSPTNPMVPAGESRVVLFRCGLCKADTEHLSPIWTWSTPVQCPKTPSPSQKPPGFSCGTSWGEPRRGTVAQG